MHLRDIIKTWDLNRISITRKLVAGALKMFPLKIPSHYPYPLLRKKTMVSGRDQLLTGNPSLRRIQALTIVEAGPAVVKVQVLKLVDPTKTMEYPYDLNRIGVPVSTRPRENIRYLHLILQAKVAVALLIILRWIQMLN
jgi:hypothetical protein